MTHCVAKVYVDKAVYHIDKAFDYLVPEDMAGTLCRGCRVAVPFGGGNRRRQGMVFAVSAVEADTVSPKMKQVLVQFDKEPVFTEEMFRIAEFMVSNTFCTFYDAVKTILPGALQMNIQTGYRLKEHIPDLPFTEQEQAVLAWLERPRTEEEYQTILSDNACPFTKEAWTNLLSLGVVRQNDSARQRVSDKTVRLLCLSDSYLEGSREFRFTPKQQEAVSFLERVQTAEPKEIMYFCGVGESVLRTLRKKGVLSVREREVLRTPDNDVREAEKLSDIILSEEQASVCRDIRQMIKEEKAQAALLYGVTGSGKTQIFIKLIEQVVSEGRQACMLVPEISLTPQMVERFKSLFGGAVAVMHSSLSLGERLDEYKRVKSGQASIVVGTRSAVFAPFDNIGIIIMDEEGESSYKSDAAPRYHAREIAKLRCVYHDAVLLLASATPSIESWYKAQKGDYRLFTLHRRYAGASLPEVYLVDQREEEQHANTSAVSRALLAQIKENFSRKEQTILFINRRGFHTIVQCIECGEAVKCPNCDAAMTFHRDNGYMMCHYCGHLVKHMQRCPSCDSPHLKRMGVGTQKIEDELHGFLPEARILRMDADTTYSRYAYAENFEAFRSGEYDILIGTQMVAKGLDFPNVTLVGVLNADTGLYAPDFRGVERVFSLITQVVGRGGRAEKKGRAYIQTYQPDHPVINYAAKQDFQSFYEDEIVSRKALKYPPFYDICTVGFSGVTAEAASAAAGQFLGIMKEEIAGYEGRLSFQALGPMQPAIHKMNGKYREKLLIKCRFGQTFRSYMRQCLLKAGKDKYFRNIALYVDVNGDMGL